MQQTPDWSQGDKYLRENAPELVSIMDQYGPCTLQPKGKQEYFRVLLTGMVAQQLPPEVSLRLMEQIEALAGGSLTPEGFLGIEAEALLEIGLTKVKAEYARAFAQLLVEKTLDIEEFDSLTDAKLLKQLLQVRGLGQWTIELFMLLTLNRPDVLPGDDFILKKQCQLLFKLDKLPKRGQLIKLTEAWRPWRSLATWYLWQAKQD